MTTLPPGGDLPGDDGVLELHPDSPLRRAALEVERTNSDAALAALRAAVREYRAVNNTRELLD